MNSAMKRRMNSAMKRRILARHRLAWWRFHIGVLLLCALTGLLGAALQFSLWLLACIIAAGIIFEANRFVQAWNELDEAKDEVQTIPDD